MLTILNFLENKLYLVNIENKMDRPKKLSNKRLNQCKEAAFKTATETGIELEDYDRTKLKFSKKIFLY
jgi:hypothetical protein